MVCLNRQDQYIYIYIAIVALLACGCSKDRNFSVPDGQVPGEGRSDAALQFVSDEEEQSLFDYTQDGILPIGSVLQTHEVTVSGITHYVEEIDDGDPFTGFYQMPDGDLVLTNLNLEDVISFAGTGEELSTEVWTGPEGSCDVVVDQIMASFIEEATQQDIEDFIYENDLRVIMSDFEAASPSSAGNTIAYFRFGLEESEFESVEEAYDFFDAHELIEQASPNVLDPDCISMDYAQGHSGDQYYVAGECRHVNIFGVSADLPPSLVPPAMWENNNITLLSAPPFPALRASLSSALLPAAAVAPTCA